MLCSSGPVRAEDNRFLDLQLPALFLVHVTRADQICQPHWSKCQAVCFWCYLMLCGYFRKNRAVQTKATSVGQKATSSDCEAITLAFNIDRSKNRQGFVALNHRTAIGRNQKLPNEANQ